MNEFVRFQTTLWSRIRLVQNQDPVAVADFVNRYRPPVLRFLGRAGYPEPDAEDLSQEVFTRLLAEDVLSKADRERGKFRSFLLAVVRNVIREDRRKRLSLKRGGERPALSLDREEVAEPAAPEPPEEEFDRAWLDHLLGSALEVLEREQPVQHRALAAHVLQGKEYREIASDLGKSLQDVKNYIHRSRQRLMDLLRQEIWRYASSNEEYEEEVRTLSRFLGPV